jgi:serralysin
VAQPTNQEQELLELINRARLNPSAEAAKLVTNFTTATGANADITSAIRFFNVDVNLFAQRMATFSAVAPLAWNSAIGDAAEAHSLRMIATDTQSHQLPGELGLSQRMEAAGYTNWRSVGENIYAYGSNILEIHAAYMIDWGGPDGGMQSPAGHRQNILSATFTEVGLDITTETNSATGVGTLVSTQDFGTRFNYSPQLLGVAFRDGDSDRFYDAGEGLGNVTVTARGTAGTFTTTTFGSGGYQMVLPAGSYTVTFSGGGLSQSSSLSVVMGTSNTKLDFNAAAVTLPTGTAGRDTFTATSSNDNFNGAGDIDTVVYALTRANATVTVGANSVLTLTGTGTGTDTLTAIERLQFSDGTLAFDTSGNAGQVYRLYQAAFARTPDTPGLKHNVGLVDNGLTLQQMSSAFIVSNEFQQKYGTNVSNTTYINALYQNVLGRGPDTVGFDGWQARLNDGSWTRSTMLIGFSESPENIAKVAAAIANGIWLA